jgi:hypothetical protein
VEPPKMGGFLLENRLFSPNIFPLYPQYILGFLWYSSHQNMAKNGQKTVLSSQKCLLWVLYDDEVWGHKHPAFVPTHDSKELRS